MTVVVFSPWMEPREPTSADRCTREPTCHPDGPGRRSGSASVHDGSSGDPAVCTSKRPGVSSRSSTVTWSPVVSDRGGADGVPGRRVAAPALLLRRGLPHRRGRRTPPRTTPRTAVAVVVGAPAPRPHRLPQRAAGHDQVTSCARFEEGAASPRWLDAEGLAVAVASGAAFAPKVAAGSDDVRDRADHLSSAADAADRSS